jgi:hemin uptake protein HemP
MKEQKPQKTEPQPTPNGAAKHVRSEALFGERRELVIEHAGREYTLRITQNGKLILTA